MTPEPSTTPAVNEKPFGINQIRAYIPILLDLEKHNYDLWKELFETHCLSFGVLAHIDGSSSTTTAVTKKWQEEDGLIKMWIYGTVSEKILDIILKAKATARDLWLSLENLFHDNKEAQAIQYDNELRTLEIGDLSIADYCHKLKTLSDVLANLDSPVPDRSLVLYMLNGLSDKFDAIINVIQHQSPFPSFTKARSMLLAEEKRINKNVKPTATNDSGSSSSTVLYSAQTSPAHSHPPQQQSYHHNSGGRGRGGRGRGGRNRGRGRFNNNRWPPQSYGYQLPPWSFHQSPWHVSPAYAPPPMYPSMPYPPPSPSAPPSPASSGILGFYPPPSPQAHYSHQASPTPSVASSPSLSSLPHAFSTMSLADPNDSGWFMDTGATNHISTQPGTLRSLFNESYHSPVTVGNGSLVRVTHNGDSSIPSLSRPLHLRNVLVCPTMIKNLISVRRFATDNLCSVEFDPFGFSVKDLHTQQRLLRCDSSGPLYSVTPPSSSPIALSVSAPTGTLWHRRLGHPGSSTLKFLSSSGFISFPSHDMTTLCHACQLGKHVRLPFSSSTSVTLRPFDIIHSDIWTSPISSVSGIKYYVVFLDDFSHYVWIYPLKRKSDTLRRYLHFSAMIRTHFHREIGALQCDNGREFDNQLFRDQLSSTDTMFRFSCPYTSQQNGKAERLLRTLNNLVRTLLFQAHMPPVYWVEALHTAAYLLNILPSSAINNEIPLTRLLHTQVTYDHLRVFGCLCYPNLLATSSHKLSPRSTPCVFLGYPNEHRGYRLLDLSTNKIILSRHVIFDEGTFPFATRLPAPTSPPLLPSLAPILRRSPSPPAPPTDPPTPAPSPPAAPSPTPSPIPPPPPPPPRQRHPMQTRLRDGIRKPVTRLCLHTCDVSPLPTSHIAAAKDPNWNPAMGEEYDALIKTGTWDLVPRPKNANVVRSMWLFRHKFDSTGKLARYKARLVANGRSQQAGVDCDETFSPVIKPATIRSVLHVAVTKNWPLHQLDVKNAFLHGDLKETVYMHQPPGFKDPSRPDHVCLLRRSLYGLKQAPRAWFHRFATFASRLGFVQSVMDTSLFVLCRGRELAYLLLYVDDIILTASSPALLTSIINSLSAEFPLSDDGPLHHFLGISVTRNDKGLFLHQQNYIADLLHRADMTNCKPCLSPVDTKPKLAASDGEPFSDPTLYRSLAGALQYLTFTRPDIAYAVQQICLFMHDPRESHFLALKRILRYLKGTITHGLHLHSSSSMSLVAYSDADWAGCPDTRRSTSGFGIFLGDNLVSWSAKRQPTVSRSSAESEYKGVANTVAELTWLRNLLLELKLPITTASLVYCDNISVVYLSTNPVQHQRTKHIEIDIHFVREKVALGHVKVLHVPTSLQYADIFTKGLPTTVFLDFRSSLNVRQPPDQTAGGGVLDRYLQ